MRAYVDESVDVVGEPGVYVLAGVVVLKADAAEARAALLDSRGNRRDRFHWRNEELVDREAMAKTVGGLDLLSVVAVCAPIDRKRQGRARQLCMTQMIWELERCGVHDILMESRGQQDSEDRKGIRDSQRSRAVSPQLSYTFARPASEPLLWLPDLVAGAVADKRSDRGKAGDSLALIGPRITIVEAGSGT